MSSINLKLTKSEFKLFVDYLELVVENLQERQRELIQSNAPQNDVDDVRSLIRQFTNKGQELRPLINNYISSGASQEGNLLEFTEDQLMNIGAEFVNISNELRASPFINIRQDGQALHALAMKIIDQIPYSENNNNNAGPRNRLHPKTSNASAGPEARRRRNRRTTRKNRKSRKNRKASRRS